MSLLRPRSSLSTVMTASTISNIGDGMMFVAVPLLATQVTDNVGLIAAVTASQQLPWLVLSVWAGVKVDRHRPALVMMAADLARMFIVFSIALTTLFDATTIWQLLASAFALGTGDVLFSPANQTLYPLLVEHSDLASTNGLAVTLTALGETGLGPVLGGALFALASPLPFAINGLSFAFSAFLLARLASVRAKATEGAAEEEKASVREALRWFFHQPALVTMTAVTAAVALGNTTLLSVMVLIGKDRLGLSDLEYGFFYMSSAIGSVAGGLLAERLWKTLGTRWLMLAAGLVSALAYLVTGVSRVPAIAAGALFLESIAVPALTVVTLTLRQTLAPIGRIGQTTNIFRLFVLGAAPVGAVIGGVTTARWGPGAAAIAAGCVTAGGCALLIRPIFRRPEFARPMPS